MPANVNPPEPILTWEDVRGYQLSDRIWNVSENTASQIDMLLEEYITEGKSTVSLAKELEQFLLPGREFPRTDRPYGSDGSFNARRLARSEITLANSRATLEASSLNPFVEKMLYNLSGSHVAEKGGDICEDYADESDANGGFAVEECPVPIQDTHSQCMCYLTMAVMAMEDAIAMIREGLTDDQQAEVDLWTNDSLLALLEQALLGLAAEFFAEWFEG